ncbi:aminotransferase class I/II-fold pyridoxal phosphate-dependent enzyme [bacterium]|jgi:alanine-synthesizing transaminase|nr:aminotransferase class I/II-fold pyridoxal phosphate-dependent enzyme [bacterium]
MSNGDVSTVLRDGSDEREQVDRLDQKDNFTIPVAERVLRLPPYLFGKINEIKYKKRRAGVDIIDLGMGNPTDPPDPQIVEKLCEAVQDPRNHRYSASAGILNLRREVAVQYDRRHGVKLDPHTEVIATIGSKEGFSHMCLAMLGPGDTCIVPAPSFPIHVYSPALASANVLQIDVTKPDFFLSEISHICDTLYPKPKIVIVNFPHNPSSTTIEKDFYVDLVRLAKKYQFYVLSDFAYADIFYDGYVPPSFLAVPGAKEVGVEFTTMSKGYNMAGWRIGYCVGNKEMVKALATIKGYYDYGIFQAIQIASIIALRHAEHARLAMSAEYQMRRDVLVNGLRKGGWEIDPPRAGMFVWAKIPQYWREKMGSIDLAMKLLEEAAVAASPGRGFGPSGEDYLRLAIVENEQRLKQAVRQINRCLKVEPAVQT